MPAGRKGKDLSLLKGKAAKLLLEAMMSSSTRRSYERFLATFLEYLGMDVNRFVGKTIRALLERFTKTILLVTLLCLPAPSIFVFSANSSHPKLFFNNSGIKQLELKTTCEYGRGSFDALIKYAKLCAKTPVTRPTDRKGDYTPHLGAIQDLYSRAETLAFAWLMTRDETYARIAKEYLLSLQTWESWQDSPYDDLSMAGISRGLAICYDWLYEYLRPEERATFRTMIERSAGWLYSESIKEKQWWTIAYAQNHLAISHASLGLAGLVLSGEHPDAENWVNLASFKIKKYLDNGCPDGGWGEGVYYWHYGTYQILLFADALRCVTGKDLYGHWWLREAWRFPFYCLSPTRQGLVNFADCNYETSLVERVGVVMLKLAAEYRNGYAQWFAQITDAVRKTGSHRTPWNFIWYDPSVPATEPIDLPPSKLFRGIGWAVFRTGWKDSDTLFALRAGTWWVHNHGDQNSFVLESLGERLVIDPGYGKRSKEYFKLKTDPYVASVGHNTVLIDNLGQEVKHPSEHPLKGGTIKSFISLSVYDYVSGDASATYPSPMQLFTRKITFVKPSYLVICDELRSARASSFSWLLHTLGKIEVRQDTILVKGNKASLLVKVLNPPKWDHQILHDQKHMIGWEKEEPIEYVKIESGSKVESLRFLVVMVPVPFQGDSLPFSVVGVSEASVLGATISRDDIVDKHLYRLTGDRVVVGNIQFEGQNCFISSRAEGTVQQFALHDGTSLRLNGKVLVSSSKPISTAIILGNDTTEGIIETTEDCTLELTAQDRPAVVLLDGKAMNKYRFDSDKRTVTLFVRGGSHSLKMWGQSFYRKVQELLCLAHEKYEATGKRRFSSHTAVALIEESRTLIQKASQAFERHDLDLARKYSEDAIRLLSEAVTTEEKSQTTKHLQLTLACLIAVAAIVGLLLNRRRKGRGQKCSRVHGQTSNRERKYFIQKLQAAKTDC
ncbi:MAG: heparinase II/III family protein [Candidatus Bathyarchaeia archaeon]